MFKRRKQPTVEEIAEELQKEQALEDWYHSIEEKEKKIPMKVLIKVGKKLYGETFLEDPFIVAGRTGRSFILVDRTNSGLTDEEISLFLKKREHVADVAQEVVKSLKSKEVK